MRISDWSSDVCSSDHAHPLKAAAYRTRRAEALGIEWTHTPIATLSAPRGKSHPCISRGFLLQDVLPTIGRASFRDCVCPYLLISVVSFSFYIIFFFFFFLSLFFSFFFFFFFFF